MTTEEAKELLVGTEGENVWWLRWVAPAVIVSLLGGAATSGLYWGRNELRVDLARIEERVADHMREDIHEGAVPRAELSVELRSIHRRMDELLDRMTTLEQSIDRR